MPLVKDDRIPDGKRGTGAATVEATGEVIVLESPVHECFIESVDCKDMPCSHGEVAGHCLGLVRLAEPEAAKPLLALATSLAPVKRCRVFGARAEIKITTEKLRFIDRGRLLLVEWDEVPDHEITVAGSLAMDFHEIFRGQAVTIDEENQVILLESAGEQGAKAVVADL